MFYKFNNFVNFSLLLTSSFLFLPIAIGTSPLQSQTLAPLSQEVNRRMENRIIRTDPSYFTLLKPYLQNDSVFPEYYQSYRSRTESWFRRKLLHESLVQVDSSDYFLFFDPAFDLTAGQDHTGRKIFTNTRGFNAGGRLGSKFAFATSFYENQAIFPVWINNSINEKIITGQGRGRLNGQTWDYAHVSGYLSFSPWRKMNVQLGQGKNFIGDGYRSLLLSDVAYNYPYGRITWLGQKVMYSWMLGVIQDLTISNGNDRYAFGKRTISSHMLAGNVAPWLQVAVIKNTVYNNPDTVGNFEPGIALFNPVILPVNPDNSHSIWGINAKALISKKLWLYSQMAIDNLIGGDKHLAFQFGAKYFDALGLNGLYLQAEYNQAEPSMYSWSDKTLPWLHYRESLAHPYGNNFSEAIFNLGYSWRRWQFNSFTRLSRQLKAMDGNNSNNTVFPTMDKTKVLLNHTQLKWYLNPRTTSHFSLGYVTHLESISGIENKGSYLYFAFRTTLFNNYLGF